MKHEEYIKRRDELLAIRMESFSSFDKAVLSLSTGSLALSIAFLDKIGEPFSAATFSLIVFTWVSFFLVFLFNLGSHYFARANMDCKISELDSRYKKELDEGRADNSAEAVFWQNRATTYCNTGALIAFTVGVFFFISYIVIIQSNNYSQLKANIGKENMMSEENVPLKEGQTESPRAISQMVHNPGDIITHGAVEPPQAVLSPVTPDRGATEAPQAVLSPAKPSGPVQPAQSADSASTTSQKKD